MSSKIDWAEEVLYEFDLGMSQHCNHCMQHLEEGWLVWKSKESPDEFYCSDRCVQGATPRTETFVSRQDSRTMAGWEGDEAPRTEYDFGGES